MAKIISNLKLIAREFSRYKLKDKDLERRIKEMSEWYECPVNNCDRMGFTKRGLFTHIRARHLDFYNRWCWNKSTDYLLEALQITKSNE